MKKKTKSILINLAYLILIFSVLIMVIILTFNALSNSEGGTQNTTQTYLKCCNGNFCTDTYYSEDRDKCILSLCEGSPLIFNKAKCEYEPER